MSHCNSYCNEMLGHDNKWYKFSSTGHYELALTGNKNSTSCKNRWFRVSLEHISSIQAKKILKKKFLCWPKIFRLDIFLKFFFRYSLNFQTIMNNSRGLWLGGEPIFTIQGLVQSWAKCKLVLEFSGTLWGRTRKDLVI